MLLNNKQMEATRDTFELKTVPRHSTVTEYEIFLKIRNLVSVCDWKLPCLSGTFPK